MPTNDSAMQVITGAAADGRAVKAIYMAQPKTGVAFAVALIDHELPRVVHWGRPLAHPRAVLSMVDALQPQRVSGALDETQWPSVLPTQAESWTGATRFVVRRGGIELFCKFAVTDVRIEDGDAATFTVDAADEGQGGRADMDLRADGQRLGAAAGRSSQHRRGRVGRRQGGARLRRACGCA
jgi:alpha-galactosidase